MSSSNRLERLQRMRNLISTAHVPPPSTSPFPSSRSVKADKRYLRGQPLLFARELDSLRLILETKIQILFFLAAFGVLLAFFFLEGSHTGLVVGVGEQLLAERSDGNRTRACVLGYYFFLFFTALITAFTKSFSFQQMKAKKSSNSPVLTTKVHTVLSMWIYFWV